MSGDAGGDLHVRKDSHMALPVTSGLELHLKREDVGMECKPNKTYTISIPMICTSSDEDSSRFRQLGNLEVAAARVFTSTAPNGDDKKKPGEKTKHGNEVERYNESK